MVTANQKSTVDTQIRNNTPNLTLKIIINHRRLREWKKKD